MAQLFDPYHSCPVCEQPTENLNLCDSCIDKTAYMMRQYEEVRCSKREPRKADQNE
jgi:hypothetical protein